MVMMLRSLSHPSRALVRRTRQHDRRLSIGSNILPATAVLSFVDNETCFSRRMHSTLASTATFLPNTHNCAINDTSAIVIPSHICQTVRNKSVFVSKHNQSLQITSRDILDFCQQHGIATHDARTTSTHVILKECPFCSKPTLGKADNYHKCYIQIGGGAYFCHRCGSGGSWFDLKQRLGGFQVQSNGDVMYGSTENRVPVTKSQRTQVASYQPAGMHKNKQPTATDRRFAEYMRQSEPTQKQVPPLPMPSPRLQACYSTQLLDQQPNDCLTYLQTERGLSLRTLRKYGVGRAKYNFLNDQNQWEATECVTFPWLMSVASVEYQEELRGADYVWDKGNKLTSDVPSNGETDDAEQEEDDSDESNKEDDSDESEAASDESDKEEAANVKEQTFLTRRIKVRALAKKAWQRLDPPGGGWGLFGFHTIPKGAKEVVLTEGEYDAMAVWQATGRPAVSLPNGCRSLPVEVLPLLEDFETIYLWMDNDGPGQEGADLFAKKIGLNRCYIVRPSVEDGEKAPKDANEALLLGLNLDEMIQQAKLIPHERILTFQELRSDVLHEILHPDKYVGVPMTSLPGLMNIMKGFRRGELTVITGPTGSGKTTFLGQMSLDLAEQDINVLWGSFEIKNTRLMHKLLQQFAREPLPTGDPSMINKLEAIADRFERLPFHFMKFHGGSEVDDVLDAMDYAGTSVSFFLFLL